MRKFPGHFDCPKKERLLAPRENDCQTIVYQIPPPVPVNGPIRKCRRKILLTNRDQERIFADEGLLSRLPRPDVLLGISHRGITWLHNAACRCYSCEYIPDKGECWIITVVETHCRLRWCVSGRVEGQAHKAGKTLTRRQRVRIILVVKNPPINLLDIRWEVSCRLIRVYRAVVVGGVHCSACWVAISSYGGRLVGRCICIWWSVVLSCLFVNSGSCTLMRSSHGEEELTRKGSKNDANSGCQVITAEEKKNSNRTIVGILFVMISYSYEPSRKWMIQSQT